MAGFGDFREAERKLEQKAKGIKASSAVKPAVEKAKQRVKSAKKKAKPSVSSSSGKRNQVEYRHRNAESSSRSNPSSSLLEKLPSAKERTRETNRSTSLKPYIPNLSEQMALLYGNKKKRDAENKREKPLNLQYLSSEITGGSKARNGVGDFKTEERRLEKLYNPFDYEKIKEHNETVRERSKERNEAALRSYAQGLRGIQRSLNQVAYARNESADSPYRATSGRGPVPLSMQEKIDQQDRENSASFFAKDAKRYEQIMKDIENGNISEFGSKFMQGAGQLTAEMPLMLLGGGAGAAAKGGAKGVQVAGKAINALASPATPYYLASNYGNQYYQARQEGATKKEANQSALLYSPVATLAERLGGADAAVTKAFGKNLGDNILSTIIKGAASEGLEETAQTSYGNLTKKTYKDVPLFSTNPEQDAIINPRQMADAAVIGGTLGGLAGGAIHGMSNLANRTKSSPRNTKENKDINSLVVDGLQLPAAPKDDVFASNNSIPDSAENSNTFGGKDMETIKREYQEAVDDNITEFAERVLNNDFHPKEKMNIGKISERSIRDISDIVHFDVNNYSAVIKPETIQHIVKRHGENGQQDHSMANIEDISRIRYVLDNYDIVEPNPGRITGYSDKNGKLAKSVRYMKRVNGNYYAVVAVPDTARKEMVIVTAYKNKADQQAPDATNGPRDYVRNVPLAESASNNSIPDSSENINPLNDGDTNMLVTSKQVDAYIEYAYTYGQSSVLPKQKSYLEIAKPSQRLVDDLQGEFDVSGYTHALRDNDIRHIRNSHGEQTNEKYPVTKQDLKQIPDIIENYDEVYYSGSGKTKGIYYMKRHNGVTYYLEQITNNYDNKPLLINKQMIKVPTGTVPDIKRLKEAIEKRNSNHRPAGTVAPTGYTPEALNDTVSISSIPDSAENSNPLNDGEMYQNAVNKYGAQKEAPATPVPNQTAEDNRVSRFAQTEMDSGLLNEAEQDTLRQRIVDGEESLVYIPFTDVKAQKMADTALSNQGFINAYNQFKGVVDGKKRVTKGDIALGERLIVEANAMGDTKTRDELLADVAILGREAGQAVQAISMLSKQSPVGVLTYYERLIDRINNRYLEKYGDKYAPVTLNEELKTKLLNAKNWEEIAAVEDEINRHIVSQIPATLQDKIDAWRYLAMLGNPKTHLRNVIGNTLNNAMRVEKNAIGSILEAGLQKVGKLDTRTKTFYNPFSSKARELRSFAKDYFKQNQDEIMLGGKYEIDNYDQRRIYNNNILEGARKLNSGALEAEDTMFSKPAFVGSFTSFAMANNMTLPELRQNPEMFERARQYATLEAQKSTFREASELANTLNDLENKNAYAKVVIGGIVPFKKTPANIAKRAVEYSPVGLLDTVTRQSYRLRQGNITVNEYIDKMAAGLTGTSVAALGAFLASMGIISIGGDDENEKNNSYQTMQGEQNYSLNIGNQTFSLDWAAPSSIPLFFGAEVYHMATEQNENADEETIFSSVMEMVTKMTDPMLEMSMLDGLNSALTSFNNDSVGGTIGGVAANTVESYLGQFTPTLLRQTASTLDPTQRSSYVPQNAEMKPVQKYLVSQLQKIPGVRNEALEPNIDHWGREQTDESNLGIRALKNFLSPANIKANNTTDVDREIERLYDATGQSEVIPTLADGKISINGKDVYLSREQLTQYRKTRGNTAFEILSEAIKGETYQGLSDEEKAKYIQSVILTQRSGLCSDKLVSQSPISFSSKVNMISLASSRLFDTFSNFLAFSLERSDSKYILLIFALGVQRFTLISP